MKLSAARKAMLQKAAEAFHRNLDEAPSAYLEGRGLTEEVREAFLLGVVSADAGPTFEKYIGRLSLPYITPTGVVSIRFRCVEDHECEGHPKYLQMAGDSDHLFNVGALHERHPAVAITEGEIDAITADRVLPAVGIPGATKWKPFWGRLFEDHERVYLLGDGDKAGREFCDKLVEKVPNAQPVVFPAGHDVNSYFLEHGEEALSAFILGGEPDAI